MPGVSGTGLTRGVGAKGEGGDNAGSPEGGGAWPQRRASLWMEPRLRGGGEGGARTWEAGP